MYRLISMATSTYHHAHSPFHAHLYQEIFRTRKRNGIMKVSVKKAKLSESNGKRANLSARKKERIKLPNYGHGENRIYHISEFLSHPSGIEAILNTRALQSYQSLDSNLYRCILPQVQLLTFEVAPVLDLLVTPTSEDCVVETLSCKFEGSDVERQNEHFSEPMIAKLSWIRSLPELDRGLTRVSLMLEECIWRNRFCFLSKSFGLQSLFFQKQYVKQLIECCCLSSGRVLVWTALVLKWLGILFVVRKIKAASD